MSRPWLVTGAALGALGVVLGAFGAHLLRNSLTPEFLSTYETAVRYLQLHALALLATGILMAHPSPGRWLRWAAWGFAAGCLLFSGSLVLLALSGWTWLGAITPFGGLAWIAAWIALAAGCAQKARP
jgi:uncharacterized membrane protein YgdD (TMEM256/DUF423 family)